MSARNRGAQVTGVVFFDLDGTLTDPKTGIVGSIRFALDRLGLECPEKDDLTWCIGPPLLDSFSSLVGNTLAAEALKHYRERFDEHGWRENVPYAGIAEALEQLKSKQFELYVATSKPRVFADRIVKHFQLDKYFSEVFGSELDGTRSDKGDLLRFARERVGPATIPIMVGDRMHDVVGAKRNGMRAVGVTYGYGSRQELEQAGADAFADSPGQIVTAMYESVR
jgi:phosphoglycolate phosphatase